MNLAEAGRGSSLRSRVAERLGQERFGLWFSACEFSSADSKFTIRSPNRFVQECIRRNCLQELQQFAQELFGPHGSLVFEIGVDSVTGPQLAKLVAPTPAANVVLPSPKQTSTFSRRKFATFESLVVGASNQLAFTAAQMVIENTGQMNPLYLYGPVGVGKTHLLEAIWTASRKRRRTAIYLTAEQFTSDFVTSMQGGLPSFRRKYRSVDVLLVDDLQFFQGKKATSQELHYTISGLVSEGRQVVLSGDKPPQELVALGEEFTSRLVGGMACRIESANFAMRCDLIRRLADHHALNLPSDVFDYIAQHVNGNARELMGAINRLQATQCATGEPIRLHSVEVALRDLIRHGRPPLRLAAIERVVADRFGLTVEDIHSRKRAKGIVQPRMLTMWLARNLMKMAYREIGKHLGGRTHSTVISACQQVDAWRANGEVIQLGEQTLHIDTAIREIQSQLESLA